MPLTVAAEGGAHHRGVARTLLRSGADKVSINSAAVRPARIRQGRRPKIRRSM